MQVTVGAQTAIRVNPVLDAVIRRNSGDVQIFPYRVVSLRPINLFGVILKGQLSDYDKSRLLLCIQ